MKVVVVLDPKTFKPDVFRYDEPGQVPPIIDPPAPEEPKDTEPPKPEPKPS